MVELDTLIQILVGIFFIGGGIISFFVMQKGQNMKIDQLKIDADKLKEDLEKEIESLKKKQSKSTEHQIETEGLVREINVKLEHIMLAIDDLKKNGNP